MKRLILGGLSVLFVCAVTAPAKASEKEVSSIQKSLPISLPTKPQWAGLSCKTPSYSKV